jgi:hypothetical protein
VTRHYLTRKEWQTFRPETLHATVHEGRYVAFYQTGIGNGIVGSTTNPTGVYS